MIYAKRAFVHHYINYVNENYFSEAREELAAYEKDFEILGPCGDYGEEGHGESEE